MDFLIEGACFISWAEHEICFISPLLRVVDAGYILQRHSN